MKLNLVPARAGAGWVKTGIRTFWRQPLALSGLFFMMMALLSLASLVPVVGTVLALVLLPGATLGLMVATREATQGRFPMPTLLLSAFRAGQQRLRAMLTLGALYTVGFVAVLALSALADGGKMARFYLLGEALTPEALQAADVQLATWIAMASYVPLSLAFWHAPALVHWHQLAPVQSLFYSIVACTRNVGAYTVYGLAWMGVFLGAGLVVSVVGGLVGGRGLVSVIMLPAAMLLAAMFFTSLWFTFQDTFSTGDAPVVTTDAPPGI